MVPGVFCIIPAMADWIDAADSNAHICILFKHGESVET